MLRNETVSHFGFDSIAAAIIQLLATIYSLCLSYHDNKYANVATVDK